MTSARVGGATRRAARIVPPQITRLRADLDPGPCCPDQRPASGDLQVRSGRGSWTCFEAAVLTTLRTSGRRSCRPRTAAMMSPVGQTRSQSHTAGRPLRARRHRTARAPAAGRMQASSAWAPSAVAASVIAPVTDTRPDAYLAAQGGRSRSGARLRTPRAELDPTRRGPRWCGPSAVWIRRPRRSIRTLMASLAVVGSSLTRCPNARQLPQLLSPFLTA